MNTPELGINIEKDVNIHLENQKESRAFFWFIWILYAVVFMTKNCYNGALASIVAEGVLTKSQTGFITAMFYLVYTPLQIVGGLFSDRFSPERMIKIGLVGASVANAVIFFNHNYYVMLCAWMFNGMIQFGIWPSVFKIISSQLVRSDRTQMTFYISFTSTAGLLLSYLLAAVVPSWEYNFAFSAIILSIFAIVLHIYERHLNPYMRWDKKEDVSEQANSKNKTKPDVPTIKILIANGFFFMLISTVLAVVVSQSRSTLASVMFVENYDNISPSLGNILTTVLILSGMVGTLIARRMVDKIRNEIAGTIVIFAVMIPFLILCSFVGAIPVVIMIAMLCIIACLESVVTLLRNYYNMHFVRYGKRGTIAGLMNAGTALSFMLAAYVMPRIAELFGWRMLIVTWPVLILLAMVSLCLAVRTFKRFIEITF